jgi:hypothetical protein
MDLWTDDELHRLDAALLSRQDLADATYGVESPEACALMRACIALDRELYRRWVQESTS